MFKISDSKLAEVVEIVTSYHPQASRETVVDFIQADWSNAAEHQAWLDEAPAKEIASWVMAGDNLNGDDEE